MAERDLREIIKIKELSYGKVPKHLGSTYLVVSCINNTLMNKCCESALGCRLVRQS